MTVGYSCGSLYYCEDCGEQLFEERLLKNPEEAAMVVRIDSVEDELALGVKLCSSEEKCLNPITLLHSGSKRGCFLSFKQTDDEMLRLKSRHQFQSVWFDHYLDEKKTC